MKIIGELRTVRNGLILVVLAALLPMTVLSVVQGSAASTDSRELAIGQLRANAQAIAESERDTLLVAQHALAIVSRGPSVRAMDERCSPALVSVGKSSTGIVNFIRSDATGRIRCSALPFQPGTTFAGEEWWQRAVKIDGLSLSSPIIGTVSRRRVLVMALPIKDRTGRFDGLVSAAVSLEALESSLDRRRRADPDAAVTILNANGETILSNEAAKRDVFALPPDPSATSWRSPDGVEWLYAVVPLFGRQLSVVYAKPAHALLAAGLGQVRQSILLPLLAMVMASLAIWVGTNWLVVRWLHRLQALAAEFGRGNFAGDRAGYASAPREVAALSDDLHVMADTIERRDIALTTALESKTALTREVHHRVKNNLQIVTSLLTLQADRVSDASARDMLAQAKARIAALGLIHRVLYQHEPNSELGTVNMRLVMIELCPQLRVANRAHGDIDLRWHCDDVEFSVDQAVPLTLFIVEAVNNAFRHGFAESRRGAIVITMTSDGGLARLSIVDDGIGYDVAGPVGKMGFELMSAFATQLEGKLVIKSTPAGTDIELCHPLKLYA